jgi:EAL domain-containing protein (putative c-di-GMP-specific phosphodiesterase class I)
MTEVLLLVSLTVSGLLVCGIARVPWVFWLTTLTPALIAATGWPRSNDDDKVMRFARLSVVALATLVLGTGPAPAVMLVLIWTLAVAPLYPLLLPYRATVLTISVATIILSAPVTLRMLTEGYLPQVELELLAVLVAATPVVAAVSYAVARAAEPSRALIGTPSEDVPVTEIPAGGAATGSVVEQLTPGPGRVEQDASLLPPAPAWPAQLRDPADTGTTMLGRRRDPNSPWAVPTTDDDRRTEAASGELPSLPGTDSSPVPGPGDGSDLDVLATTGELLDRITTTTSNSDVLGGSTALFLIELEKRATAPLSARREIFTEVVRRLRAGVPAQDAVLRVEEDTVALLAGGIDAEACRSMARRLTALVEEPVRTVQGSSVARCAIGIALLDKHVRTPQDLLDAASRALDQARRDGSQQGVLHGPALLTHTTTRTELESELRQSIIERSIEVLLQPVAGLRPNPEVLRVEALARLWRPDGVSLPPWQFVPLAEELGLGPELGRLVLDRTLEIWTAFRAAGRSLPGLSLNVSPSQLEDPDFPEHLATRLHSHQVQPGSFTLELPAAAFRDTEQSRTGLAMLHSVGVRLCLDNFGPPGISVNGLSELPIDEVKLDRTLVHGPVMDERLIGSVIALAHSLDLPVVVVGVETPGQLDTVTRLGADAVQGTLLARPLSAEDLDAGISAARRLVRGRYEPSGAASFR